MSGRHDKPLVAVTGPNEGGTPAWVCAAWAIRRAGGRPVHVTPKRPLSASRRIDALVIGGGADVSDAGGEVHEPLPPLAAEEPPQRKLAAYAFAPALYLLRRALSTRLRGIDTERDALELELLDRARNEDIPVLGICRGAQLMNVYAGGSLLRDLSDYYVEMPQPWTPFPRKRVRIDRTSRLFEALDCEECAVNSLHRHAIDRLGTSLRVVAREFNGLVQAIEDSDHPFWIGVQWHPEYMPQLRSQMNLFEGLVQAARATSMQGVRSPQFASP